MLNEDTLVVYTAQICPSFSNASVLLVHCAYMSVLVYHNCLPCLTRAYICPCLPLSPSLFTARMCLSLSTTIALLVYRTYVSVFVYHYCPPCLPRVYVCPCRTLVLSLSNDARQGKQLRQGHPLIY